jgi:hypothetical protein
MGIEPTSEAWEASLTQQLTRAVAKSRQVTEHWDVYSVKAKRPNRKCDRDGVIEGDVLWLQFG